MNLKHTLLIGAMLTSSFTLFAQKDAVKKEAAKDTPKEVARPEPGADDKAWMTYMTPGPMHQMLAKCNGDWSQDVTFWMAPGTPATKTESKCSNRMILGDRYQESVTVGNMMGMPFEGRSLVGYDNAKKVFQSTWIDNMGTGVMYMEGPYDEKTKTITLKGKVVDPMTGKEEMTRQTLKFIDDNNQLMEMYSTKDGKEFKSMEIKYTRR